MDSYDSRSPQDRRRHPEGVTPIYDRLLAEWQATRGDPEPDPPRAGGLVPAARTSGEAFRG
ncbi:hypothetical protein OG322_05905 [Streptomyces sp. NBC_01260]|uniref:Uncharacterized protein n=1 Tax=Streptomyces laculatispora TaxID=887464 RepID=A0ABY9I0M8_9ACTN|nr:MULTISPECIES: hypothetical protein [Streptomyces]MCX4768936.1 hypothetical protein [Streptomyces sp. NBC_01285]ROQ76904.1 hypothetical protein EDD95_3388 [Streptomyces sp. CEV 2-1]RPK40997.1 hypothetical protein EES39_23610 [Streptomyces sp. ADI92-24]WLQ39792.1 hypothetical protein P8A22_07085 [Streptomyces laculatispora]